MKAIYLLLILAVLSGAVLPIQAALNAKVGKAVGDPVYAALISFVIGSVGLFIYSLATKVDLAHYPGTRSGMPPSNCQALPSTKL